MRRGAVFGTRPATTRNNEKVLAVPLLHAPRFSRGWNAFLHEYCMYRCILKCACVFGSSEHGRWLLLVVAAPSVTVTPASIAIDPEVASKNENSRETRRVER